MEYTCYTETVLSNEGAEQNHHKHQKDMQHHNEKAMKKALILTKCEASNDFATDLHGRFYIPEERDPEKWMWVEATFGEETKDRLYVFNDESATWEEKGGEYFADEEAEDKMSEFPDELLAELYLATRGARRIFE